MKSTDYFYLLNKFEGAIKILSSGDTYFNRVKNAYFHVWTLKSTLLLPEDFYSDFDSISNNTDLLGFHENNIPNVLTDEVEINNKLSETVELFFSIYRELSNRYFNLHFSEAI